MKKGVKFYSVKFYIMSIIIGCFLLNTMGIAFAQDGNSLLGGMENDILKVANNVLVYKMPAGWNNLSNEPIVLVAGIFCIFFALIYTIAQKVPPFKSGEGGEFIRGPTIAFSIGVAAVLLWSTPILKITTDRMQQLASIGAIALFIVGLVFIYFLLSGAWHSGKKIHAEALTGSAQARTQMHTAQIETKKAESELKRETELLKSEDSAICQVRNNASAALSSATNIKAKLSSMAHTIGTLQSIRDEGVLAQEKEKTIESLSAIAATLSKKDPAAIRTLKTEITTADNRLHGIRTALGAEEDDIKVFLQNKNRGVFSTAAVGAPITIATFNPAHATMITTIHTHLNQAITELDRIKTATNSILSDPSQVNQKLQDVIKHLHDKQFPQALLSINDAIRLETNEATALAGITNHTTAVQKQVTLVETEVVAVLNGHAVTV